MEPITFTARKHPLPNEVSVDFGLQLVGSLPVHSLTTMPMLPWVVAEVRRLSRQSSRKEPVTKQVRLCVSPSGLRCEPEPGRSQQWDPLICSSIFECKPQHVHKLIHNSHDPSYFACLIKEDAVHRQSICHVFKADDQTKAQASILLTVACQPQPTTTEGAVHGWPGTGRTSEDTGLGLRFGGEA
uniref:PID domain-containing protein n=1 Tax=Macaca fascicularis TaxID=9541 RepID=A0A2K5X5X0_MACFA